MTAIVAITLYSGAEYVWGMRACCGRVSSARRSRPSRLAGLSLAVPLFYLPALDRPDDPTFAILGLLAAEFAAGGLDNSLVQLGYARSAGPDLFRSGFQAALRRGALVGALSGAGPRIALIGHPVSPSA